MAEIDPVVLEMRADVSKYLNPLERARVTADKSLGFQERRIRDLETQMRKSSGAIGASIKGLAATFATAFTGRELIGLIDGFTRLQNSLKVAGLEGQNLLGVQERLRAIGATYGVEIEALGQVFSRASLAQKELGASTEEIIRLNEIIAAGLKITGTSSQEASGALLQLGQALGSDIVRGEEFNSVLEGALPIAQAAARGIERFGGSVAKLRAEVVEGNVTSKEFFEGILRGGIQTIKDADAATLTLGGAFTVLRNELTLYVGEAAKTNNITTALAEGIKLLAENLDRIIPALGVIAVIALGRFAAGAVAGGRAMQVLSAYASIATTSLAGTALAARGAGAALLAAFGGPVGVAITALTLGLGYLATRSIEASKATERLEGAVKSQAEELDVLIAKLDAAKVNTDRLKDAAYRAAAGGDAAAAAYSRAARAAEDLAKQSGLATLKMRQENIAEIQRERAKVERGLAKSPAALKAAGSIIGKPGDALRQDLLRQRALLIQQEAQERSLLIGEVEAKRQGVDLSGGGGGSAASADKKEKKTKTPKGPSAQDILDRFNSQLQALAQQTLSAQISLTSDANERAELESRSLELARIRTEAEIKTDSDLSKTQKKRLLQQVELLSDFERERIERDRINAVEQERFDILSAARDNERDVLQGSLALAETRQERAQIEERLIALQYQQELAEQQLVLDSQDSSDAQKAIAQARKNILVALEGQARAESAIANQSPGQQFLRSIELSGKNIDDQFEGVAVNGLQNLNDQLVDAIFNAESLGDVFSNVAKSIVADLLRIAIQQAVIRPLAENLFGGGGGGGGGGLFSKIGSLFGAASKVGSIVAGGAGSTGGIFARASGGPVAPGQVYRINEGASPGRVEGFVGPSTGGQIVPLGRMDAARGGMQSGGTVRIVIEEREGFVSQVQSIAQGVSVEVVRATAPAIVDAGASEALRRSSRPRI